MAVGGAGESMLATGAADATVAVWEDCTAADEEAAAAEDAAVVLKQQDLSNALQVCTCMLNHDGIDLPVVPDLGHNNMRRLISSYVNYPCFIAGMCTPGCSLVTSRNAH